MGEARRLRGTRGKERREVGRKTVKDTKYCDEGGGGQESEGGEKPGKSERGGKERRRERERVKETKRETDVGEGEDRVKGKR